MSITAIRNFTHNYSGVNAHLLVSPLISLTPKILGKARQF